MKSILTFLLMSLMALGGLIVHTVNQHAQINELSQTVIQLEGQVQTLETDLAATQTALAVAQQNLALAEENLQLTEKDLAAARNEVARLEKQLAQQQAALQAQRSLPEPNQQLATFQWPWPLPAALVELGKQAAGWSAWLVVPSVGVAGMVLWSGTHKPRKIPAVKMWPKPPAGLVTVVMTRQQASAYAQWRRQTEKTLHP